MRVKGLNIVKDPKVDGYQRGFASMVYKVFDKKLLVVVLKVKIFLIKNYQKNYTDQLLETLIKKVLSPFIDNIWGADLTNTELISKFHKRFRFLLCVIDIYSKYAWVALLRDKKGVKITNAFQKVLKE